MSDETSEVKETVKVILHALAVEVERQAERIDQMERAIAWVCGYPVKGIEDFGSMTRDIKAPYWWRNPLLAAAGLTSDDLRKYQDGAEGGDT